MTALGARLARTVSDAFAGQAVDHGRKLHAKAVEIRSRDPLATFLLDTFGRQVRDFAGRAEAAVAAGDRRAAMEMAGAADRAHTNLGRVRAALEGVD